MKAFEAEQEAKGMKAAKNGKAFAGKQLDASLPRGIEELCSMAGLRL